MKLKLLRCQTCGGDLSTADFSTNVVNCIYCGSPYSVEGKQAARGGKLAGLLTLAEQCRSEKKAAEANKYYNRVIEIDPSNVAAWIGRGITEPSFSSKSYERALSLASDRQSVAKSIVRAMSLDGFDIVGGSAAAEYALGLDPTSIDAAVYLIDLPHADQCDSSVLSIYQKVLVATHFSRPATDAVAARLKQCLRQSRGNPYVVDSVARFNAEVMNGHEAVDSLITAMRKEADTQKELAIKIAARQFYASLIFCFVLASLAAIFIGYPVGCATNYYIYGEGANYRFNFYEVCGALGVGGVVFSWLLFTWPEEHR